MISVYLGIMLFFLRSAEVRKNSSFSGFYGGSPACVIGLCVILLHWKLKTKNSK